MSHTVIFTPSGIKADVQDGTSVYDAALDAGVDMQSICGGKGLCKRCQIELQAGKHAKFKVEVLDEHLTPLTATENKALKDGELEPGRRLACRSKIKGNIVVHVPSDSRSLETSIRKESFAVDVELDASVKLYMCDLDIPSLENNPVDGETMTLALQEHGVTAYSNHRVLIKLQSILAKHDRKVICVVRDDTQIVDVWPPSPFNLFGAAIDIGSTSIALYVYDLSVGTLVYEKSAMNPQIRFGEDLMSRVSYIMINKGAEDQLTTEIRKKVNSMLLEASTALGLEPNQLLEVILVGNPIMHHFFLGISPISLGQAPFTLATKYWFEGPALDFDLEISKVARVSFFPLVGGHVGADTTAAYLTQINAMKDRSVLLVDIGTNAEIVLSHNGKVAAASSPTGPAFEGAEISSGVRATTGAIERVRIDPMTKQCSVRIIGCEDWLLDGDSTIKQHSIVGICGSGIFEVMVELANAGLIDESGLFIPEASPDRFFQDGNSWKFLLVDRPERPIFIKQTDVRSVQLAKAALSAGVSLLAEYLECNEFDEVLLAGAFGTHLDAAYVAQIGIIPNAPSEKIRSIGNAAGMGAATALLNVGEKKRIIEAVKNIEKVETATEPKFQEFFVAAMKFPTGQKSSQAAGRRRRRRA